MKGAINAMKKKNFIKRVFTILLSAMILLSMLPVSVFANNDNTNEVASKIVREVTELREESVKHFLCEDGSYIAVSYAEPIHYEENGRWKEIDNTLVLSSKNTYVPKSNDLEVSIPKSFSGGGKITATNKGHTINFGVNPGNKNVVFSKTASVKEVEELSSTAALEKNSNILKKAKATTQKADGISEIEKYNSTKTVVDNQAGALLYDKIFPNADLEYIVNGNSIKENIVVHQKQKEYVYTFDMDFGGLIPVEQEDGSYRIIDSAKPDETVFVLAAPYMYDADGTESYEVEMSLAANGNKYLLTLSADATWINNSQRAFPVVIDPTLYYDFDDVFVMDGVFNQNTTKIGNELRVGRNLANLTRTYIKISEPQNIALGSHITDAKLILSVDYYFQAINEEDIEIYIYDCYNLPNWTATSVTWNNQPFGNTDNSHNNYSSDRLDSLDAAEDKEDYNFNITEAVRRWLMTGVNKGFMLASSDETSKIQLDFHSSRSNVDKPLIQVNYVPPRLSTNKWETDKDAATSHEILVNSTASWTASANQSWISLSTTSGTGVSAFTVSVTENFSTSCRSGEVTVTMSTGEICTLEVFQGGITDYFSADKNKLTFGYKGTDNSNAQGYWAADDYLTKVVDISTSYIWSEDINYQEATEQSWLKAEKKDGDLYVTVTDTNNTNTVRKANICIKTGDFTLHEIEVIQLDEVSSYFNQINPDGSSGIKSSSEYNHGLATWAMELSYAAYNYPDGTDLPDIPGDFMDEVDYTAADVLRDLDFSSDDILEANYDPDFGVAAHTIAHREITINNNDIMGDDNYDTESFKLFDDDTVSLFNGNISTIKNDSGGSFYGSFGNSENTSLSTDDNQTRELVVVAVRGSVTFSDWLYDVGNQFDLDCYNFEECCQEVLNSLYGVEECNVCDGTNPDCETCLGYLASEGITNPIILVTGHSLGGAVANLTADYLNQELGVENVYAYTFATPNTVNIANGEEAIPYTNIFNILNNNDLIPHFPMDDFGEIFGGEWVRHGQDFHITMPWNSLGIGKFDTDLLGAFGHGMPTYYDWMKNLPNTFGKSPENITVTDLDAIKEDFAVGLFAKLLKAKCPIDVTLYDSDGNIVAFESQQEDIIYPNITEDAGILSWIADDGSKMFMIPYGSEEIEARIEAYGDGTMTLTVEQPGIGEPLDTRTYNNVTLYSGKEFKVDVAENFDSEKVELMNIITNENGQVTGVEIIDNPYLKSVSVDDPVVAYGTVSTFTIVTTKDASKIQFIYSSSGDTMTLTRDDSRVISLVEDGDNLIWTVQKVFPGGDHIFDFGVKIDKTWYITENVIALNVY